MMHQALPEAHQVRGIDRIERAPVAAWPHCCPAQRQRRYSSVVYVRAVSLTPSRDLGRGRAIAARRTKAVPH